MLYSTILPSLLIVVVGHTGCRDVLNQSPPNLHAILGTIVSNFAGGSDPDVAVCGNIDSNVNIVKKDVSVMKAGAEVIGALYDMASGEVTFEAGSAGLLVKLATALSCYILHG